MTNEQVGTMSKHLSYELTQWLVDRGFVSDADKVYALRAIEELILAFVDTRFKKLVREAQRARDVVGDEAGSTYR